MPEFMAQQNIIFLPDKYFQNKKKKYFWKKKEKTLTEKLQELEIYEFKFSNYKNKFKNYLFDDSNIPKINTLYIFLCDNNYYSSNIYPLKKLEKERELLLLLSGALGVSEIKYKIETSNINIDLGDYKTNINNLNIGTAINKTVSNFKESSYTEKYTNRGAPLYITSKTLEEVDKNIKKRFKLLGSFSEEFYSNSDKLKTFIFKRYCLKMESLNYYNESEEVYERSIEVSLLLMNYGFGIKFKNYIYNMQKITYDINFFTEKELRLELDRIIHFNEDPFFIIRENYTNHEDKNVAVNYIIDYIREHSKTIIIHNQEESRDYSIFSIFTDWVRNNYTTFFELCHTFTSTYEIELWLKNTIQLNPDEYYTSDSKYKYIANEYKNRNYEEYKERFLDLEDVQTPIDQISMCSSENNFNTPIALPPIIPYSNIQESNQTDNNSENNQSDNIQENNQTDNNSENNQTDNSENNQTDNNSENISINNNLINQTV